jgi:hypothetical protein
VVAGHPVHAAFGQAGAAEDVAAADHHRDLDAQFADIAHFAGNAADDIRIDAVVFTAPGAPRR